MPNYKDGGAARVKKSNTPSPAKSAHHTDAMSLLRKLAVDATNAAADPQEIANPDLTLLNLCDRIVNLIQERELQRQRWSERLIQSNSTPEENATAGKEQNRRGCEIGRLLRRAGEMKAATPAGIYSKAIVVSRGGDLATLFAKSLANDLLGSQTLRAVLWPTQSHASV